MLAFDQLGFGQRLLEKTDFYNRYANQDWSILGEMTEDVMSAVDALLWRHDDDFPDKLPLSSCYNGKWFPTIDPQSIYVAGYALGGIVALYAAALDIRIAGVASLSAITPLRNNSLALKIGGNAALYEWHALQPRLGWFQDEAVLEATFPYDYDDVLDMVSPRPALVAVQTQDRTCNVPALSQLLGRIEPRLPLLTVEYLNSTNMLNDELVGTMVNWLGSVVRV